jgi:hypothetical protein
MEPPNTDPTPAVLALFEGPLRDVKFPGADSAELARVVDAARAAREAVAHAESALAAARDALRHAHDNVARQTERTLAYARVYASDNAALLAAIEAAAPRSPRRGPGRPRKDAATSGPPAPRAKAASARSVPEADDAAAE